MLGRTILRVLHGKTTTDGKPFEIIPTDLPEADITDEECIDSVIAKYAPDAVIHCAAMTAVDKCEEAVDFAYKLNQRGSANVAAACNRHNVRLIAISTDYVFEGSSDRPYNEFDETTGGNTIYGKSKYAGEEAIRALCPNHVIARISWLYGFGGPSFVHAMLGLAKAKQVEVEGGERKPLKVVADQVGNPTSAIAVARKLGEILARPKLCGTFHLTCEGEASWADFAAEIFAQKGIEQKIVPCTTEEFPRPAPRPKNSRLDKMALRLAGFSPMPDWREALLEFMKLEFA